MTNAFFAERVVVYEVLYSFKGRTAEDVAPDFAAPDALFLAEAEEDPLKFRLFAGKSGSGTAFSYTGTNACSKSGISAKSEPSSFDHACALRAVTVFFCEQSAAQNKTAAVIKSADENNNTVFFFMGTPLFKNIIRRIRVKRKSSVTRPLDFIIKQC
ncbi:hypothetical protein HMPREF9193_00735 [Treponema lecithinolyticum ATCC 700332]|uniref:Uncharacterized protein n=1 Tax=Treponema lecithinolyticum ATCC 700332 TaxID=1321815 RepID=A0ABN0P022_TRELE|nr:hypothetical protein HMPREF9193_00735 [Treponema lecithinolyticum ATCC 700332]